MKSIFLPMALLLAGLTQSNAQMHYSLTSTTSTFTPISNGTAPFLTGNNSDQISDEGYANFVPIGFNFSYNGSGTFNEVAVSTNGFISFNSLTNSYLLNNLSSGANGERPIVAPLWDDINLPSTNNLQYTTIGSAPNRVFVVEWLNAKWGFGASNAAISFQVKLYETSNWIEFNYRQETGSALAPSASIGLTAAGMGTSNFISLQAATSTPGASVSNEVNNISVKPPTNQSYVFKPGALPVNFGSFSVSKNNGVHVINWQTLNETNNIGFDIERSADGKNFSSILHVNSKASNGSSVSSLSYTATDNKPIDGTNYYRLRQTDKDGRENYSAIASIKNTAQDNWASINIYPNPVKEKLSIQVNSKQDTEVTVTVYNAQGNAILQKNYAVINGSTQLSTDVSFLQTGMYTVRITNNKNDMPLIKTFVK